MLSLSIKGYDTITYVEISFSCNAGKESTLQVALQPVWEKNVWGFNGHTSESELFTYTGKFRYPDKCYFNCSRKSNSLNQLPDGVNYGLGINEGLCICIYGQKGRRNEPTKAYNNAVIDYGMEFLHINLIKVKFLRVNIILK